MTKPKHEVTLEDYETLLQGQVSAFFTHWRKKHATNRKDYPLSLSAHTRVGAFIEWEDHFRAWQDTQDLRGDQYEEPTQ